MLDIKFLKEVNRAKRDIGCGAIEGECHSSIPSCPNQFGKNRVCDLTSCYPSEFNWIGTRYQSSRIEEKREIVISVPWKKKRRGLF